MYPSRVYRPSGVQFTIVAVSREGPGITAHEFAPELVSPPSPGYLDSQQNLRIDPISVDEAWMVLGGGPGWGDAPNWLRSAGVWRGRFETANAEAVLTHDDLDFEARAGERGWASGRPALGDLARSQRRKL